MDKQQSFPRFIWYLATIGFACILGASYLAYWGYDESFLRLNAFSSPFFDQFMPHWTHMGEGAIFSCLLILWLLKRDLALAITIAVAMIGVAVIVAGLKQGLFMDWHRPAAVFGAEQFRFLSLGAERHFSFPSGHSTAAATLYAFLSFSLPAPRRWFGLLWGLLAISIAYTRIYIGVHFLGDVIAGLLLGCVLAFIALKWFYPFVERFCQSSQAKSLSRWRLGMGLFAVGLCLFAIWQLLQTYYL